MNALERIKEIEDYQAEVRIIDPNDWRLPIKTQQLAMNVSELLRAFRVMREIAIESGARGFTIRKASDPVELSQPVPYSIALEKYAPACVDEGFEERMAKETK